MKETHVRVRRERPTVVAWSLALTVTMLAVYALTCTAARPDDTAQVSAPRVTRDIQSDALKRWCVTLGSYDDPAEARVSAADCARRGAASLVHPSGDSFQILGALYDTQRAADRAAAKLRDAGIDADVLPIEAAVLTLRITAPETQIELIESADALLCEQVTKLSDMATLLERGRLSNEDARTLCAVAATDASALSERLSHCGAKAESVAQRLAVLSAQLQAVAHSPAAAVPLAGQLRLAAIDTLLGLAEIREEMNGDK